MIKIEHKHRCGIKSYYCNSIARAKFLIIEIILNNLDELTNNRDEILNELENQKYEAAIRLYQNESKEFFQITEEEFDVPRIQGINDIRKEIKKIRANDYQIGVAKFTDKTIAPYCVKRKNGDVATFPTKLDAYNAKFELPVGEHLYTWQPAELIKSFYKAVDNKRRKSLVSELYPK